MNSVENVLVIGHTDCGARNFNEGAIKARLMGRAPEYKDEIEGMQFGKILGE
jgi:carbonic anhydrase